MADLDGIDHKDVQLRELTSDGYTGDKQNLIQNGDTGVNSCTPVEKDVSPLHLGASDDKLAREKKKTAQGLQVIIISSIVFAVSVTVALIVTIYFAPPQVTPHGAVACDDERCSQIGADIMRSHKGSAMDGAIATLFCLSVVQPESSGLGGGGFLVNREHKKKKSTVINFRETAPANIDPSKISSDPEIGSAVGVPGALKGYYEAHKQFGKVSWETLIKPSIELAREGYKLHRNGAEKIREYVDCTADDKLAELYCKDGKPLQEKETVKLKSYADVLEDISQNGIASFYNGKLAEEIVATVLDKGGNMTKGDLKNYDVETGKTIVSSFGGMTVESVPVPGGGVFALLLLNILDNYKFKNVDKADLYHYIIESQRFSLAMFETLGDPNFNKGLEKLVDKYLSADFAKKIFERIKQNQTLPEQTISEFFANVSTTARRSTHTTHVSVIGPNEDHVSITGSLNFNFGSRIVTPSGIILNNHMADFNLEDPQSRNYPAGGKRPMSHISPVVAHSQDRPCGLRLAVGGAGSQLIPSEVAEVIINLLKLRMDVKEAVSDARVLADGLTHVLYDGGLDSGVVDDLKAKGHNMTEAESYGVVNAVMKVNETLSAAADERRADKPGKSGEVVF